MLIDPDRDGCTIWEGNKVQHLNDTAKQCCYRIYNYATFEVEESNRKFRKQVRPILLDTNGFGILFAYIFDELGLKYQYVTPARFIP